MWDFEAKPMEEVAFVKLEMYDSEKKMVIYNTYFTKSPTWIGEKKTSCKNKKVVALKRALDFLFWKSRWGKSGYEHVFPAS